MRQKDGHVHASVGRLHVDVEVDAGADGEAARVRQEAAGGLAMAEPTQHGGHVGFLHRGGAQRITCSISAVRFSVSQLW